jgi:hypothetical protein
VRRSLRACSTKKNRRGGEGKGVKNKFIFSTLEFEGNKLYSFEK